MNEIELRTIPTVQLVNAIGAFEQQGDQAMVNRIAKELAYRIWVPNSETSFEEMMRSFGYKEPEKPKTLGRTM